MKVLRRNNSLVWGFLPREECSHTHGPLVVLVHSMPREVELVSLEEENEHVWLNTFLLSSSWELPFYRSQGSLPQHIESSLEVTLLLQRRPAVA